MRSKSPLSDIFRESPLSEEKLDFSPKLDFSLKVDFSWFSKVNWKSSILILFIIKSGNFIIDSFNCINKLIIVILCSCVWFFNIGLINDNFNNSGEYCINDSIFVNNNCIDLVASFDTKRISEISLSIIVLINSFCIALIKVWRSLLDGIETITRYTSYMKLSKESRR